MKFNSLVSISALFVLSIFMACGNDGDAAQKLTGEGDVLQPGTAPAVTTDAPTAEPAQNAEGVWHYTCTKGCAGGAGAATACATCGGTLVHNQVYHGKAAPASSANPAGGLDQALGAPGATLASPSAGKNEPPQNAAGVWHYICEAGCAGGGGAAGNCAKCQKPLLHNKAYH